MFHVAVMQFCGVQNIPGVTGSGAQTWQAGKLGGVCGGESIDECKSFYGAKTDSELEGIACSVCPRMKGRA